MMAVHSLRFFLDFIFWPNYVAYMVYIVAKVVLVVIYITEFCQRSFYKPPKHKETLCEIMSLLVSPRVIIILCYILLAFTTVWDIFWLRMSLVCSDDPGVSCFPIIVDPSLNLTVDLNTPIDDCAIWEREGVSNEVEIVCFQFVYNLGGSIAALGGVLVFAFFATSPRINSSFKCPSQLVKFLKKCLDSCRSCFKKSGFKQCIQCLHISVAGVGIFVIEVALALVVTYFTYNALTNDETELLSWESYFIQNGAESLLLLGITSTALLLPWQRYERSHIKSHHTDGNQEAFKMKGIKNAESRV